MVEIEFLEFSKTRDPANIYELVFTKLLHLFLSQTYSRKSLENYRLGNYNLYYSPYKYQQLMESCFVSIDILIAGAREFRTHVVFVMLQFGLMIIKYVAP